MKTTCEAPFGTDAAAYYASHSVMSDPGALGWLLEGTPRDPEGIARVVSGLVLHPGFVAIELSLTTP